MSERDFLGAGAKEDARRAIADVEAQTSAEIALCVCRSVGRYREADYLFGFLTAIVALVAVLFLPHDFALWSIPVDLALGFAIGAYFCSRTPSLRRLLTPATDARRQARAAAHSVFVEQRLSRLPGRNAILVYVALFERAIIVVPDLGLDPERLGPRWKPALDDLSAAMSPRPDWNRFLERLRALGPVLGAAYPRHADDVNEMSDTMSVE